jgi:3-hydroxyacyl-CoA dehydrogenase
MMRIRRLGVVGAGTMGAGIAALAASAGVPVVLLDVPATEGDPSGTAKKGLERQLKAWTRIAHPSFASATRAMT